MLARASSDASARLRRSKSTSTVHRHAPSLIEPLDPDVAQQHAVAAATAAFARYHAQEPVERRANRSIELGRSKSTASRKSLTSQGSHFPPRELSARSVPTQKPTQTNSGHRLNTASATEQLLSFNPTPASNRTTLAPRQLSAQPSITFSEHARPNSQPKAHRQNAASSIASQQIRKARSMYYASSVQTGSPIARPPAKYLTTPPPVSASPALSNAPTAYVPTRSTGPSPLVGPRMIVAVASDETVDTARDRYLQNFQQPRSIKHKPSLFLAPFKKRQNKPKDKIKRLSSNGASVPSKTYSFADETVVGITVSDFMPQVEVKERRSFSGSLKRKFKRVFKQTSAKAPSLPVQQIDASRDYFGDTAVRPAGDHDDIPSPEAHLLRRVQSRTPSFDGNHSHPIRSASRSSSRGSVRSNRSLHSEVNVPLASASRVTSWGTSASGETLTQRAIKRLTVIHEAKDSIGSMNDRPLSASIKPRSLPLPTLSAFKDPMHMESLVEEASTPPIDPKRVFSALMREIDASKTVEDSANQMRTPGAESDVFESSTTKGLHNSGSELLASGNTGLAPLLSNGQKLATGRPASLAARSVHSKKSSIKSFGQTIRSTIRAVTPSEHHSSPCPDEPSAVQLGSDTPSSGTSSCSHGVQESRTALFKRLHLPKKRSGTLTQNVSIATATPTATQIEMRVAKAKNRWQTTLNECPTPQFPRETDRLYTMAESSQQQSIDRFTATAERNPSTQSPSVPMSKPLQTPMSPSVYSRNTDGISLLPNDSVMSFDISYDSNVTHQGGSAVILTSQSVRSYVIGTPSPNRPSSTRSSRDWKEWLSHEVSGIESSSKEDTTIDQQSATASGKYKHALNSVVGTPQAASEDITVIMRGSFETSTPRAAGPVRTVVLGTDQQTTKQLLSELNQNHSKSAPDRDHTDADQAKKLLLDQDQSKGHLPFAPVSTPIAHRDHTISTLDGPSTPTQQPLDTPTSARMNDRFPFLNTGGRSSSNKSSRSCQSKSPTSSVGSSSEKPRAPPAPKAIYSHVSALVPGSTITDSAVMRKANPTLKSKENVTPPSNMGFKRPEISPFGLTKRPKSLQPLSSAALNRNPINTAHLSSKATNTNEPKCAPSPSETIVACPGLRVTIRPLSPEKLSRRPRSAFDLRHTPSPRPASELRRPALQLKASSRLSTGNDSPATDNEVSGDGPHDDSQRQGSLTPGQRMTERFLKERESANVLERGVRKSPGKFVREDTPAFL